MLTSNTTTDKKNTVQPTTKTDNKQAVNKTDTATANANDSVNKVVNKKDATASNQSTSNQPTSNQKTLPVDVTISGKVYTINCPAGEENELKKAVTYINDFINDIRKQGPLLTHENLLVLCCLNLYEQMQQTQKMQQSNSHTSVQIHHLVDKMIKDMQIT